MSDYFSDRENGPRARTDQVISADRNLENINGPIPRG
jgi:hypothetical protein